MVKRGCARENLQLLGGMPTITPPMWTTLATGCYPMTHGVLDYNIQVGNDLEFVQGIHHLLYAGQSAQICADFAQWCRMV